MCNLLKSAFNNHNDTMLLKYGIYNAMQEASYTKHQQTNEDRCPIVERQNNDLSDAKFLLFLFRLLQVVQVFLEDVTFDTEHVFVAEVTPVEIGQIARVEGPIGFMEAKAKKNKL